MNTTGRRRVIWNMPSVTADGLKMFACIVMFLETVGITIIQNGLIHLDQYTQEGLSQALAEDSHLMVLAGVGSVLQLVGGMAIPVFAFLLVEGFLNTSNYRNYLLSVVLFALLSEIPYDLAMSGTFFDLSSQNALISTAVCLLMLYCLRVMEAQGGIAGGILQLIVVLGAVVWVTLFRAEYGLCMVLLTALFYIFRSKNVVKILLGIVISLMYVTGPLAFYGIWCYSGERKNRLPKYAYYVFYPLHLLVLGAVVKIFLK